MPDEETTQQPAEEQPKEEVFEFVGAGFIPNRPGLYANCRVVFWTENGELKSRVEPLGGVAWTLAPAEPASEPAKPAQPVEQSTVQEQPQQESQGG